MAAPRRASHSLEHKEERRGADDQCDGEIEDAHLARHHNASVAEEPVSAGELLPPADRRRRRRRWHGGRALRSPPHSRRTGRRLRPDPCPQDTLQSAPPTRPLPAGHTAVSTPDPTPARGTHCSQHLRPDLCPRDTLQSAPLTRPLSAGHTAVSPSDPTPVRRTPCIQPLRPDPCPRDTLQSAPPTQPLPAARGQGTGVTSDRTPARRTHCSQHLCSMKINCQMFDTAYYQIVRAGRSRPCFSYPDLTSTQLSYWLLPPELKKDGQNFVILAD